MNMEAKELREKIMEMLTEKHNSSNGSCGLLPVDLKTRLNVPYQQVREQLNYLYENGHIRVRDGINGYLLFIKKPLM